MKSPLVEPRQLDWKRDGDRRLVAFQVQWSLLGVLAAPCLAKLQEGRLPPQTSSQLQC